MNNILYRTKLHAPPFGKPPVFLVCPSEDFLKYSDNIFGDLFSVSDCVVYYLNPYEEYDIDEILSDLAEMQLFVFAVTNNLLSNSEKNLTPFLDHAKQIHIPILPLIQEPIDVEKYNEQFGKVQYLDKNTVTDSSISYEEQLKKFLTSVLVSDDVVEKVRAEFDAYIFMSYRKKDRKYANQLSHLIHRIDTCRDVAVWYDEYLVPGENFNDSILQVLDTCNLFALTVTPNLVLEENYVMKIEYPEALKLNKKIVPFEMVETDREELEKYYENFPELIDPNDAKQLEEALTTALSDIPLCTKNSAEHLFYIGAAYLWGIDVEVDHDKAKELITQASLAGNPDAISLLAIMYATGDGVDADYNKAIELYEKKIELMEKVVGLSDEVQSISSYSESLFDLSELYKLTEDYEGQKKTLEKLLKTCDQYIPNLSDTLKIKIKMLFAENAGNRGDYHSAVRILSEVLEDSKKTLDVDMSGIKIRGSKMLEILHKKQEKTSKKKECLEVRKEELLDKLNQKKLTALNEIEKIDGN